MHANWIRLLSATLLLFFAFAAACDKEPSDGDAKHSAMGAADHATLGDSSRMQCKAAFESQDRLLAVFAEARKSGDKAKMKAALEQAEAHISGMKTGMARCMRPMDMKCGMKAGKAGGDAAPVPKAPHPH